jgi:hypothetical protein
MKLDAHPLVVAAAMGLLGPAALSSIGEEREGARVQEAWGAESTEEWFPGESSPDPAELHRVEIEWLKHRAQS